MIIDKTAVEQAIEHMIECARRGEEGVGLLAEDRGRRVRHIVAAARHGRSLTTNVAAVTWTPLRNAAEFPRYRYEVAPEELLDAYQRLEDDGKAPVILVHSHLRGGPLLSEQDVRYATNPALLHMVVDLEPQRPQLWLWRVVDGRPERIRHGIADLRKQENLATDLTRDVTEV